MQHQKETDSSGAVDGAAAIVPSYAPLVAACARYGIGRCAAFKFARDGDLKTFRIGQRTYVYLESLESLPTRVGTQKRKDNRKAIEASVRSARGRRSRRR